MRLFDRILIFSDIHANLTALQKVLCDAKHFYPDAVILMGDIINYGMRPNEVIKVLQEMPYPVIANIYGNHEKAIMDGDTSHFSTDRGKTLLKYSKDLLDENSWRYIKENMNSKAYQELSIGGKKILIMHGNLDDHYWGQFDYTRIADERFKDYDYVITGHSHQPHVIPHYFTVDNPMMRNKKKVVFINPGSIGQPRNLNPCAQYALLYLNTGQIQLMATPYDVKAEQSLYPDFLDLFYRDRLALGI